MLQLLELELCNFCKTQLHFLYEWLILCRWNLIIRNAKSSRTWIVWLAIILLFSQSSHNTELWGFALCMYLIYNFQPKWLNLYFGLIGISSVHFFQYSMYFYSHLIFVIYIECISDSHLIFCSIVQIFRNATRGFRKKHIILNR